ncbi:hypothetical protein [Rathayibacter sp. AY1C6]|uniref:hypothetical protein n=1 Tax=Rathayibacter sp. AY1C6 TaxID=2080539 RepID=UPI0011B08B6E|nr:hypothetical protein [Rathayibacter sp. AY1C6]
MYSRYELLGIAPLLRTAVQLAAHEKGTTRKSGARSLSSFLEAEIGAVTAFFSGKGLGDDTLVRLLRAYCNREREATGVVRLIDRAKNEQFERSATAPFDPDRDASALKQTKSS